MKKANDIERSIGICMRIGVGIAFAIMVFGFVLHLISFNNNFEGLNQFTLSQIVQGLTCLNPYSYMALGIFVLILIPVVRVVASIILFVKEKDKTYALVTIFVLVILIISSAVAYFIG